MIKLILEHFHSTQLEYQEAIEFHQYKTSLVMVDQNSSHAKEIDL
jgi:hypothetical protein